ncbi:MAG: PAS domain S-box protein [Chitinophagales bacterium]
MKNSELGIIDWVKALKTEHAFYLGVIDLDGRFIFMNSHLIKNLHPNVLSVINKKIFDFIHPGDLEAWQSAMAQCCLTRTTSSIEIRLKNGHYRWVKWQIGWMGNSSGSTEKFLLAGFDMVDDELIKKQVRLTEHQYQSIVERLGVGILVQDQTGRVIAANQKTAEIFNTNLKHIYEENAFEQLWKTVYENDRLIGFEQSPPMMALGTSQTQANVLLSIRCELACQRWVLFNATPVFDSNPSVPAFVLTTLSDVTEEKNLKTLAEERQALFISFMNHTPSFAWIVDEEEKVQFANRSLLRYFGANESVINQRIYDILPKFIADVGHEKHQWVLHHDAPHSSVLKSALVDGREHYFHVTTFPIEGVGPSKMVGGEAWDITESYTAKTQLKKTNERLLYLSRAVSEAIWDWNMQTGQIFRDQALLNLIGFHEEKTAGLSWWYQRIHPEDRKEVEKKIQHILDNKGQSWEQEYRFLCADGEFKMVFDRGFVVYEEGHPIRMVGSLQDISELKQLEHRLFEEKLKQQKRISEAILQAQEQERTNIGHELHDNVNQILLTAKLYVDMLGKEHNLENQDELRNKTQEFILSAIEEIRKLSKALVTPQLKENGLIGCVRELIENLELVDLFVIQFTVDNEEKIESISYNLKISIFRIIQEQIKNAIRHSRARNISLYLSANHKQLHLVIEDDGIGFDARKTRRGIGLSSIYERTRLYNGKADLKTSPGKGCLLKISIPFENPKLSDRKKTS